MGADCQSLKKGRYTKEKKKHQKSMMNRQTTSHKILQAKQKTKHHEINLFIYQSILLLLHFDGFNSWGRIYDLGMLWRHSFEIALMSDSLCRTYWGRWKLEHSPFRMHFIVETPDLFFTLISVSKSKYIINYRCIIHHKFFVNFSVRIWTV